MTGIATTLKKSCEIPYWMNLLFDFRIAPSMLSIPPING